jgi:hypothetical protein
MEINNCDPYFQLQNAAMKRLIGGAQKKAVIFCTGTVRAKK